MLLAAPAFAADPILLWNQHTNRAIQTTAMDPFKATRALALESIAVFDTMRSLAGQPGFLVRLPAQADVPPDIAASAAAHAMLVYLFPDLKTQLDTALVQSLGAFPANQRRARAVAFGKAVAAAVIAIRDRDGWNAAAAAKIGSDTGQWRPTPPRFYPPLDPQWASLTPFALRLPDQFRPPGPRASGSAAFNAAREQTATIGGAHSQVRTADQTLAAHYWSDAIGTYAPAGHWNAIAAEVVRAARQDPMREAMLFAELNVAIADAAIAMADAKYTFWVWRPITAIRAGDADFPARPDWTPLLETPPHPSYVSGHSAFSAAAAAVLTAEFGATPFRAGSASISGVSRSFTNFEQAAVEAANSRLWGGIHYKFDNDDGAAIGRAVGTWVLTAFQHLDADRPPVIVLDGAGRTGLAVAAGAPVRSVEIVLDGGPITTVPVDVGGRFALPRCSRGPHAVIVTARGAGGQIARLETTMNSGG
jgi:membrane-associated phospholipid phosphatase